MRLPLLCASALALSAVSAAAPLTEKDLANRVGKALPGIEVGSVTRSPVDGLYEVALEGDVVYISAASAWGSDSIACWWRKRASRAWRSSPTTS